MDAAKLVSMMKSGELHEQKNIDAINRKVFWKFVGFPLLAYVVVSKVL